MPQLKYLNALSTYIVVVSLSDNKIWELHSLDFNGNNCVCIQLLETPDLTNSFCLYIFGVGDI